MSQPEKTLLLAVTGMSPQVVTETLYGIYKKGLEWPDQIKIFTTKKGFDQARLNLLVKGKLKALCTEYNLTLPAFTEEDIEIIPDANERPVDDARTLEDQQALANFITQRVGKLSEDSNTRIHASIAGGRKTMTFFLGYAMSIFGREYDRLSHVLVSPEFENNRDFYFPTLSSAAIEDAKGVSLDSKDAEVMLAEIPFVSQRSLFSSERLSQFSNFDYNTLVSHIKLAQQPTQIKLEFVYDRHKPTVMVNNIEIEFSRRQLDFAFYAMLAREQEEGEEIIRPKTEGDLAAVTSVLYKELALIANLPMDWHKDEMAFLKKLEDSDVLDSRSVKSLAGNGNNMGLTTNLFDSRLNYLTDYLTSKLPAALANIIKPVKTRQDTKQDYVYKILLAPYQVSFSKE